MKLKKCKYSIQEKKDVSLELGIPYVNSWEHDVDWIDSSTVVTDRDGKLVAASANDKAEEVVEQGEKGEITLYPWFQQLAVAFQTRGPLRAAVTVKFCRKVTMRVAERDLPEELGSYPLSDRQEVNGVNLLGAFFVRYLEDGDLRLRVEAALQNASDTVVERCVLRANLLGPDGRAIADSEADDPILPWAVNAMTTDFCDLKKGKLKDARIQLWLDMYFAIASKTVDAEISKSKDDDDDDES